MSIGHFNSLAEAQKLTQSQLVPGVIETIVYREPLLQLQSVPKQMPVAVTTGKSIKYNREDATLKDDVARFDPGDNLVWTSGQTYNQKEVYLKRCYLARLLDDFVVDQYGDWNNYEQIRLAETKKGVFIFLNDRIIYDDITYGGDSQVDGLHALAAEHSSDDNLDQDAGEVGLSLLKVRTMLNAMKGGCDILYIPATLGPYWDQAYEERGFAALATGTAGTFSSISKGVDKLGEPIYHFAGVPLVRTDYLVAENANSGTGTSVRAKHDTGTANYSLFGIKFGNILTQDGTGGLMLGVGNYAGEMKVYKIIYFEKLETKVDAQGIEVVTYFAPILGREMSLGRIYDFTAAAITA